MKLFVFITDITCIAEKCPNFVDLVSLLTDIEYDWDKIGVALGVENRVLGGLRRSNDDNTTKLIAILRSWMDTFPATCTWNVVLSAIGGPIVKHPSTALKIRCFLAKKEVQSKYGINLLTDN